ncbi:spore germination protein [Paenibacillus sp.]|uniref:spore germination protein n=1 Tax=Paenibacillus sp. TaxID=58172 RepID=UPI002810A28F|nr:spore germination protein [Paenibacillus sp.]
MKRKTSESSHPPDVDRLWREYQATPVDPKVERNIERAVRDLGASDDVVIRPVRYEQSEEAAAAVVYIDGLSDADVVNSYIFDMLNRSLYDVFRHEEAEERKIDMARLARELLVGIGSIRSATDMGSVYRHLLSGEAIIFIDGMDCAYRADIRQWKGRDITESSNQTSVRGPRESFTETLRTNTSLIRRRIKDPRMRLETTAIGRRTRTDVTLVYLDGIAKPSVVAETRKRLRSIDIDSVLDSGYIEELIEDGRYSLFPTIYNTEKPDGVASQLLEGKVAILVDGTPSVLLVPAQFTTFLQSTEDYYQRAFYASLLRILRFGSLFISLLLPSLYIAITTFHRDMLPATLLFSLAAQREGVPFPAFVEALVMEVTFEILREAGLRMPKAIGQAVSVVGTLVIGQAAVEAGIVSAAMVIVVSVTAISTFTIPSYSASIPIRILRFAFMGAAASFGLFGIAMGMFALLLHLCALRSFGEPYMSPLSPFRASEMEDTLIRMPRWLRFKRPGLSQGGGSVRLRIRR